LAERGAASAGPVIFGAGAGRSRAAPAAPAPGAGGAPPAFGYALQEVASRLAPVATGAAVPQLAPRPRVAREDALGEEATPETRPVVPPQVFPPAPALGGQRPGIYVWICLLGSQSFR
jgi:hypothetical protein